VPTDAVGAVFNITVTDPQGAGFITAYPCDAPRPVASNLNYADKQTVANLAMLGLSSDGTLCLYTMSTTNIIVDLTGYFVPSAGMGFNGVAPTRLLDTRVGTHLASGETRSIPLTDIPDSAVGAVVNVTATGSTSPGYLTVFPCGQGAPTASNLNYLPGATVPNLVAVGVGDQKSLCIYNYESDNVASADVIVDISGFYGTGSYAPVPVG
jgi:hypothetical protein